MDLPLLPGWVRSANRANFERRHTRSGKVCRMDV